MRGQLETRRHRVHGVGSLESIAAFPSVSLRLCVSKSVQRCARTVGNTEAQSPRSRKPGIYCRFSLCVSASLCFKIRPEMCADSWKHGGTEFTESAAWNLLPLFPLCLRVSVFQNPSRDARTVGNTEAQSSRSR
jgi:hypothetical protein